jgi:hypothetical protein
MHAASESAHARRHASGSAFEGKSPAAGVYALQQSFKTIGPPLN